MNVRYARPYALAVGLLTLSAGTAIAANYGYPPMGYPQPPAPGKMYGMPPGYQMPAPPQPPAAPTYRGYRGYGQPMQPVAPTYRGYRGYGQPMRPTASAPAVEKQAAAAAGDRNVSIQGMRFQPAEIRINTGETVTWTQRDSMPHTVTSTTGAFESGTLRGGATFSQTFDEAGTYSYICAIHPNMTGTVVVE